MTSGGIGKKELSMNETKPKKNSNFYEKLNLNIFGKEF
jgi:hypothetical protein